MLIYEVTAVVDSSLGARYEAYLRQTHIPDVLASGCFLGASLAKADGGRYRVSYEVADRATLERYLADHAPALRADVARLFLAGIEFSREVWEVLERWGA